LTGWQAEFDQPPQQQRCQNPHPELDDEGDHYQHEEYHRCSTAVAATTARHQMIPILSLCLRQ
jgi:hypothetical protein